MQVYPVCKFGINTCNALDNSVICRAALQFCTISQFNSILALAGNINVNFSLNFVVVNNFKIPMTDAMPILSLGSFNTITADWGLVACDTWLDKATWFR